MDFAGGCKDAGETITPRAMHTMQNVTFMLHDSHLLDRPEATC